MGPLNEPCLLALDGGNSKTDVLLVAEDGTVITRARAGAFVPHIVGAPAAVASLADAVAEVLAASPGGRASLVAGYLANADLPEEEKAIADAIAAQGWADHVVVGNDTLAMLRTGTDAATAVAVVCGAGHQLRRHSPRAGQTSATRHWAGSRATGAVDSASAKRFCGTPPAPRTGADPRRDWPPWSPATSSGTPPSASRRACTSGRWISDRMHEIVPLLFQAVDAGDADRRDDRRQQADEIGLLVTTTLRRLDLRATNRWTSSWAAAC